MGDHSEPLLLEKTHRMSSALQPHYKWFRLFRFRSPLLTESHLISLPGGTKMFQFPRLPLSNPIYSGGGAIPLQDGGLPHSEITGSQPLYGSPRILVFAPSFIGSWRQGILLFFLAFPQNHQEDVFPLTTFPYPIFKVQCFMTTSNIT